MKLSLLVVLILSRYAQSCTNVIVSHGASNDGNIMIGDNDDTAKRFGGVTHFAAVDKIEEGATRDIYDFETSVFMGVISQPGKTLNVMGGANEAGVVISESTMGGILELQGGENKILDYGSLITATLQRATSARDAIATIVNLTDTYGYTSTMEGYTIHI